MILSWHIEENEVSFLYCSTSLKASCSSVLSSESAMTIFLNKYVLFAGLCSSVLGKIVPKVLTEISMVFAGLASSVLGKTAQGFD